MSNLIFNHGCLINETDTNLNTIFNDLVEKLSLLKENNITLSIVEDFWNIRIQSGILSDYVTRVNDYEKSAALIRILMNSGPYFSMDDDFSTMNELLLNPDITRNTFGYNFMYSNILNDSQNILSFTHPKHINESIYSYSIDGLSGEVNNFMDIMSLRSLFIQQLEFENIDDVFKKVKSELPNIVILSPAVKSAHRHDFQGCYDKVFKAFKGLSDIELQPLAPGEDRENRFYRETNLKISPETSTTLNVRRYKEERTFVIPDQGKYIFEWHVKIGHHIRIHYYLDFVSGIVYIGHCGKHLGTAGHNS